MKRLLSPILLFSAFLCSGQERIAFKPQAMVLYDYTYQVDSLDVHSKKSILMELLYNDSASVFQAHNKGLRDSMLNALPAEDRDELNLEIMMATPFALKYSVFRYGGQIITEDNYTLNKNDQDNLLIYVEDRDLDWQIHPDTLHFNGFVLQKATAALNGVNWTAYFSTDVPILSGPYKFGGLPGLIFKVFDDKGFWTFDLAAIARTGRQIRVPSLTGSAVKVTTRVNFLREKSYYLENATVIDIASGKIVIPREEDRKKSIENDRLKSKKNNNWLERKL